MTPLEQVKILAAALRQIGAIAVPTGDNTPVLLDAQKIADDALQAAGLGPKMPFAKLKDVQDEL